MKIKYLGHSAFLIKTQNEGILIDPYLEFSKEYNNLENFKKENVKTIFVTHGHSDHFGSAMEISKLTGAPVVGVFELGNYCLSKGVEAIPAALGGKLNFSWGSATLVPAQHSSSLPNGLYMGVACGVMLNVENRNIYHAGDTSLSAEMNLLAEFYAPEVAMLPIGGHFTMGIDEACFASQLLGARTVIPMHYNSFPPIKVDMNEFVEKHNLIRGFEPTVMEIDGQIEL